MKKLFLLGVSTLLSLLMFAQPDFTAKAKALMAKMTLDEKIGQLNLIIPGDAPVTGSVVSSNVEEKIKKGGPTQSAFGYGASTTTR